MSGSSKAWGKPLAKGLAVALVAGLATIFTIIRVEKAMSMRHFPEEVMVAGADTQGKALIHVVDTNQDKNKPSVVTQQVLHDLSNNGFTAYVGKISNALPHFRLHGNCQHLFKTSKIAQDWNCKYAVNGGPFLSTWDGGCIGNVVRDGKVISSDATATNVSFGKTGGGEWVMGKTDAAIIKKYNITELVSGFGWLVYKGKSAVSSCDGDPAMMSSSDLKKVCSGSDALLQRTAVGVDKEGSLILVQVGGYGTTLSRLATMLISQGAEFAMNLDGGGSSTTVIDGSVVSGADCHKVGWRSCERPVATSLCIS